MQLTPEQLEKAAKVARSSWYPKLSEEQLEDGFTANREDWLTAITAAFAAVEPPQVDVPVGLMDKMLDAFYANHPNDPWQKYCERDRKMFREDMTAALRVALEDAEVAFREAHTKYLHSSVREVFDTAWLNGMLAWWRARLLPSNTVEERVTISHQEGGKCFVCVDGEALVELLNSQYWIGEAVKDGLIAKLKDSGAAQREAGE